MFSLKKSNDPIYQILKLSLLQMNMSVLTRMCEDCLDLVHVNLNEIEKNQFHQCAFFLVLFSCVVILFNMLYIQHYMDVIAEENNYAFLRCQNYEKSLETFSLCKSTEENSNIDLKCEISDIASRKSVKDCINQLYLLQKNYSDQYVLTKSQFSHSVILCSLVVITCVILLIQTEPSLRFILLIKALLWSVLLVVNQGRLLI